MIKSVLVTIKQKAAIFHQFMEISCKNIAIKKLVIHYFHCYKISI